MFLIGFIASLGIILISFLVLAADWRESSEAELRLLAEASRASTKLPPPIPAEVVPPPLPTETVPEMMTALRAQLKEDEVQKH